MEEKDNNQLPQDQLFKQHDDKPKGSSQQGNDDSTYWEANITENTTAQAGQEPQHEHSQQQFSQQPLDTSQNNQQHISQSQDNQQQSYQPQANQQQGYPSQHNQQDDQSYYNQQQGFQSQYNQQGDQSYYGQQQSYQPQYSQQQDYPSQNIQQQNNSSQNSQQQGYPPQDNQQQGYQSQYDQQQGYQPQYSQQQSYQQQNSQQQYTQQYGDSQYNQQQYIQQPYPKSGYSTDGSQQKPKRKSHGALIAVIIILLILGIGAGTAYAYKDVILNSYAKATKSPLEYYTYIEKNVINDGVEVLTPYLDFGKQKPEKTVAYKTSSDVTINRDALDSLLQTSLDMSLSDIESAIGIPIENISFDALVGTNGTLLNETLELSLNQVKIISTDIFIDTAASEILIRYPELSDAYIRVLGDEPENVDLSEIETMTKENTAALLKRYSNIVIDNINQVEMENTSAVSVGSITTDCTELTVTVTNEDLYNIVVDILEEAKDDEYIINIFKSYDVTEEEYQSYIDDLLTEMQDSSDTVTEDSFQMTIYVDNRGNILGREIHMDASDASFGYTVLSEKAHDEYMVYALDNNGATIFEINGEQTLNQGAYDGEATLVIRGTDVYSSDFSIDLSYEDLHTEVKNGITYQYGSITLSSLELMGLQVMIDYDVEDEIQTSKMQLQLGADTLITVDSETKHIDDYELVSPPEDAEVYSLDQIESYLSSVDIEGYISDLSDRLGVDLLSIIDYYLYDSYY